tara:strand:+ start:46 stop:558 length:513 start_codon:yes stop_codon:yes gene_type:complete
MIAKLLSRLGIEVWKDIPEYEGLYQVSNLGNVISFKRKNIKIIKKILNPKGRFFVNLYNNNGILKSYRISVLIALAFLNHKPCGHKLVVDHIDNNKINDKLYNLQVITQRQNLSKDKKNGTSKYIGVYKYGHKWRSAIRINNKKKHLGTFENEIEASQAYQQKLNKINNE